MSPETRRAALSATARIAFAAALTGCHAPAAPPPGAGPAPPPGADRGPPPGAEPATSHGADLGPPRGPDLGPPHGSGLGTPHGSGPPSPAPGSAPDAVRVAGCDTTARSGSALAAAKRCCTAVVGAAVGDGGVGLGGPDQRACCTLLVHENDARIQDGGADQLSMPYRDPCCDALDWRGSITCTPWGPPVPPELPAELVA